MEKLLSRAGSRPRSLQKPRPSSIFGCALSLQQPLPFFLLGTKQIGILGSAFIFALNLPSCSTQIANYNLKQRSFRSLHSLQDENEDLTRTSSTPEPIPLHPVNSQDVEITGAERQVLYHGEVQLAGGMFRKKSQYLVLTDKHLIRFKSMARASDIFPCIPASKRRRNDELRHSRLSSSGSLHELQTSSANESYHPILLNHVVAVYKLDDGRPYFSVEIAHLDQDRASAMTLRKHCS